jgi:hypothetical protein
LNIYVTRRNEHRQELAALSELRVMNVMGMARGGTTSRPSLDSGMDDDGPRSMRVWFRGHTIIENTLPKSEADWFEDAMRRQWKACRVLSHPVPGEADRAEPRLRVGRRSRYQALIAC